MEDQKMKTGKKKRVWHVYTIYLVTIIIQFLVEGKRAVVRALDILK